MAGEDWRGGRDAFVADVAVKLSKLIEERDAAANRLREIELLAQGFERALGEALERQSALDRAWVVDEIEKQVGALRSSFSEELLERTSYPSRIAAEARNRVASLERRADALVGNWTVEFDRLTRRIEESGQKTSSMAARMNSFEEFTGNLNLAKWITWIVVVGGAAILYQDLSSSIAALTPTFHPR